ncbi:MAG: DMT family transporter [Clostridiaceae bacterium]|nr:DMT family transporter [Clostridiaceae bacterium]
MSFIKENNAAGYILLNALMWGSSYIWSKLLIGYLPFYTILFLYSFGGLLFLTVLFFGRLRKMNKKTVLTSMGISLFSVLSNISCMMALGSTSSSNTAFIVQMSVVLTPMIMAFAQRKLPSLRSVISALTAVPGLLLLTVDFSSFRLDPGDLFALANALFFSLYLASQKLFASKTDPAQFSFIQHVTSTVIFLGMAVIFDRNQTGLANMDATAYFVLVLSILISVTTILIQSSALKFVKPERATVIYTLEPVTTTVLAYFVIGEGVGGISAIAGCMLIIAAVVITVPFRSMGKMRGLRQSIAGRSKGQHSPLKKEQYTTG